MTTAATSLLGLALPVTGELSGTWGDTVNNSITALLDSAVAGTTTLSADADVTLTTTTLAANQAREAIILWTAAGTVTRYITAPAQSKIYAVLNKSSTQSIVLRGVGPTTGVTILAGKQAMVAWDGTDYVEISSGYVDGPATSTDNAIARFDGTDGKLLQNSVVIVGDTGNITGVGTFSSGAITSSSLTATRVLFAGTSGLIQDDADLTFNGTILTSTGFAGPLNGTVGATTANTGAFTTLTTSSTVTLNGGTGNGVAYLDGSKVLTTGSALTFNGTTFGVTGSITASGTLSGTGTNTWTLQSVGASGSLVAGGWLYGGNEGLNLSPNGSGLTKRLTISYFTGAAYSEALGISNVNTGPNTGILSLLNNVALVTSSGLEVTQSQLIGYSSYAGIGTNGLAVAGNVGIGTSSPAAKLDVNGSVHIVNDLTFNRPGVGSTINSTDLLSINAAAGKSLTFNSSAVVLDSSGNLTLGTAAAGANRFLYINGVVNKAGAIGFQESGVNKWLVGNGAASENGNFEIYDAVNGNNTVITPAGNLGLGVTPSPSTAPTMDFGAWAGVGAVAGSSAAVFTSNAYYDGAWKYKLGFGVAASRYQTNDGAHSWYNAPSGTAGAAITFTQAMTLDASGNLLVGTTAALYAVGERLSVQGASGKIGQTIQATGASSIGLLLASDVATGATSAKQISFVNSGGVEVGSVTSNGTATLFNTTSDQRLKENIQDAAPASDLIDAIKVRQYDWKSDGSHQRYGFVAQELVTVAPEAVHQPVNSEEMMAVDYSKLVPMLVKEIQDLRKRLAAAGI